MSDSGETPPHRDGDPPRDESPRNERDADAHDKGIAPPPQFLAEHLETSAAQGYAKCLEAAGQTSFPNLVLLQKRKKSVD